MPPPKKASRVHSKENPVESDSFYIPTETELNEPPENFDNYLRCIYGAKGAGKSKAPARGRAGAASSGWVLMLLDFVGTRHAGRNVRKPPEIRVFAPKYQLF